MCAGSCQSNDNRCTSKESYVVHKPGMLPLLPRLTAVQDLLVTYIGADLNVMTCFWVYFAGLRAILEPDRPDC